MACSRRGPRTTGLGVFWKGGLPPCIAEGSGPRGALSEDRL